MKTKHFPFAAISLVLVNAIIYLVEIENGGIGFVKKYAMYQGALAGGDWLKLITYGFVHDGIPHMAGNILYIVSYGVLLEKLIGSLKMLIVYFSSMISAGLLIHFIGGEGKLHAGASGAGFGLTAAFLCVCFCYRMELSMIIYAIFGFICDMITCVLPGVSWQGHIGGAIAGAVTAVVILYCPAWLKKIRLWKYLRKGKMVFRQGNKRLIYCRVGCHVCLYGERKLCMTEMRDWLKIRRLSRKMSRREIHVSDSVRGGI
ncbi:MAG: rhomboid family intramembrane serine protease [Clostridia bacterium]|nr:rhomboid family intramembrane serine protease [Clostridia bacterium]